MIKLIKDKRFKSVFFFLIVFRFVMQLLVTPLLVFLGKLLINYYEVQFMSISKVNILLAKPSIWFYIILGLAIMILLLVVELSSVIVLSQYGDVEKSLFPFSLDKAKWAFRPQNLLFFPLLMIVLLGFHFSMTTVITDKFFIPEFIMDTITKTPSYRFIYAGISIVLFVIGLYLVFLFHNLFIAKYNFKVSIIKSISMVRGNTINFLISAAKIAIIASISAIVFYLFSVFTVALIIYIIPPLLKFSSLSISILFVVNKILVFLILNAIAAVNVMFITKKYEEYGGIIPKQEKIKKSRKTSVPKYILFSSMIFTLIFQGYGAYQTTLGFNNPEFLEHKVYVTSHRGNSSIAPENTISAIKAAKEERADVAEIDVQLTADGHVVVIHDFNLSRLAKDPRKVIDLTLAQLKELEVGSWFSKEFTGERIPTLEEVIQEAGTSIRLNIELKPTNDEAELAKAVVDTLEKNNYSERAVISSFNKQVLKEVKKNKPTLKVGIIVPIALGKFEFEEEIDFYSLEMSFLSKDLVEKIKNQGKEVHAWTVNSEENIKKMQQLQVNNIITDKPILAKKVLATNILEKGILEILSLLKL